MKIGIGKLKRAMGGNLGPDDPPNWQTVTGPSGRPIKFDSNKGVLVKNRTNRYTIFDEDSLLYYDVDRDSTTGTYSIVPSSSRFEQKSTSLEPGPFVGSSNKSKSKERFRGHASGGELPYTPIGLPVTPDEIKKQKEASKTSFGQQLGNFVSNPVVQGLASLVPGAGAVVGGVRALTNSNAPDLSSMAPKQPGPIDPALMQQLLGNNTPLLSEAFDYTGEKKYDQYAQTGGSLTAGMSKLKGMSDQRLSNNATLVQGNPQTTDGNMYDAGDTRVHLDHGEVVKGNMVVSNKLTNPLTGNTFAKDVAKKERLVEKLTKRNSPEDRTTINRINGDVQQLIDLQETMATNMGLRKTQPDEIAMAAGGPLPKDLNVKEFQQWLATNGVPGITVDGKWGPKTEAAYNQFKDPYLLRNRTNTLADLRDISERMNSKVGDVAALDDNAERAAQINLRTPVSPLAQLGSSVGMNNSLPYTKDPLTGQYPTDAFTTTPPNISQYRIPNERPRPDQLLTKLGVMPNLTGIVDPVTGENESAAENTNPGDNESQESNRRNITPGTALQGIAAASQMVRSFGKGPANKSYQITAPITENYYSADQALQRNQANYAQARNSIDAGSVNVRRALSNSLYGTKLSSDNQVISQTNDMNRTAKVDYENRLAQRQGQNIQLAQYKNELDARDLGAQNNAKDVAFNTLSNFGQAMDRQKSTYESLELLKQIYPDVYGNVKKKKDGK